MFHGRTADYQDVAIQGVLNYRVAQPEVLAERVDFTIDLKTGLHLEQPLDKIALTLTQLAQQMTWGYLARTPVKEVLTEGYDRVRERITEGFGADPSLERMGLELVSVRIASIQPTPELQKALEAPMREQIQQTADEAAFARRAARLAAYRELPSGVLLGLAARELAGKLEHIDHVNLTPDLLTTVLTDLVQTTTKIAPIERAHARFLEAEREVSAAIPMDWRRSRIGRDDLSRFVFEPDDIVVALGQDGLVANVAKYLGGQLVVGLNPDPSRYDGVLVPHPVDRVSVLLESCAAGRVHVEERTMVEGHRGRSPRLRMGDDALRPPLRGASAFGGLERGESLHLETEPYLTQVARWPRAGRGILAQFDDASVTVYQAYKPEIGRYAAKHGYFGGGFSLSRMSWIKPNFLWMMYRSGWGTKPGQETVLAVRIRRPGFDEILRQAVPSSWHGASHAAKQAWKADVARSAVRLQWDPDHGPSGAKQERRAIQLGLRGKVLEKYAREWIVGIEDISAFVASQRPHTHRGNRESLLVPTEHPYPVVDRDVARRLDLDW